MGTLSFTVTMSLDGYAADADGDFQWTAPGEDVFDFHVERMDAVSTEVLGRTTYELMKYWEVEPAGENWGMAEREFARKWMLIDRVVASRTLKPTELGLGSPKVVRDLTLEELDRIVAEAPREVEIFGPTVAADAIRSGRVRDFRFFLVPRIVGGGLRALPAEANLSLELIERREFSNGAVLLHYQSATEGGSG